MKHSHHKHSIWKWYFMYSYIFIIKVVRNSLLQLHWPKWNGIKILYDIFWCRIVFYIIVVKPNQQISNQIEQTAQYWISIFDIFVSYIKICGINQNIERLQTDVRAIKNTYDIFLLFYLWKRLFSLFSLWNVHNWWKYIAEYISR